MIVVDLFREMTCTRMHVSHDIRIDLQKQRVKTPKNIMSISVLTELLIMKIIHSIVMINKL